MTLPAVHMLCAQLHGELIDGRLPLWEFHVLTASSCRTADG